MWFLGAFECKIEPYITYLWIGKGWMEEEMLKMQLSRDQQVAAQWQSKKKEFPPSQLPH